jgi:hypothetical protein
MIDTNAQADDESNLTSPDIPSRIPSVRVGFRAMRQSIPRDMLLLLIPGMLSMSASHLIFSFWFFRLYSSLRGW